MEEANGRVTMAVLGAKLDSIQVTLNRIERCQDELERRMTAQEKVSSGREERINNLEDTVKSVRDRDTAGSIIAYILAAGAGFIGWFK